MSTAIFAAIQVDLSTGSITYPKLDGFVLDVERVYSTAERFLRHCGGNLEMAVRQAIHQQLIAHQGMAGIRRLAGKAVA
jgi:hypothetical protein